MDRYIAIEKLVTWTTIGLTCFKLGMRYSDYLFMKQIKTMKWKKP